MIELAPGLVRAGYSCPCGCSPAVDYTRGADLVEEGCCCGNHFAVGPNATATLVPKVGFRQESQSFGTPWGEPLEAAWLVGPSVHGPSPESHGHEHEEHHGHEHGAMDEGKAEPSVDPVCGMTVDPGTARAKGLHSSYEGTDYFFCGKGCKLEFDEDPKRYLDPSYVPSM